jgi:hypothetical protein
LDRAFGDVVDKLLQILRNLIEEFMQTDEVWPLYIPVRLFRLEAEVQSIGQLLIQQINHRRRVFGFRSLLVGIDFVLISMQNLALK